jgi:hypothetical protein
MIPHNKMECLNMECAHKQNMLMHSSLHQDFHASYGLKPCVTVFGYKTDCQRVHSMAKHHMKCLMGRNPTLPIFENVVLQHTSKILLLVNWMPMHKKAD